MTEVITNYLNRKPVTNNSLRRLNARGGRRLVNREYNIITAAARPTNTATGEANYKKVVSYKKRVY